MPAPGVATVAGGNLTQSTFVKSSGADHKFVVCGAGDQVMGVVARGSRRAPYSGLDDGYAAIDGEPFRMHGPGEICLLTVAAAVNAGERLKAAAGGKGTPVTANNDQYGAVALEDASGDGVAINVRVEVGVHGA